MTENNYDKKSGFGFIVILLLVISLGGGAWYFNSTGELKNALDNLKGKANEELVIENKKAPHKTTETKTPKSNIVPLTALAPLKDMLRERVLGFPSAPIKISEHSSLTCSHCGQFHRETFQEFKREYLVTGRAYLVFSDFPLNAPALIASMATRCVAEEHYFDMVQELFANQDDWAYDAKYLEYLENVSASYGLPKALFQECTQNQELRQGILNQMQLAQTASNIRSTPTFVINDIGQINGALPYKEFYTAIEAAVAPAPISEPTPISEDAVIPSTGE